MTWALDRKAPTWVVVGARNRGRTTLEQRPEHDELVGVACRQDRTVAFRRIAR